MANEINILVKASDQASGVLKNVEASARKAGGVIGTALKAGPLVAVTAIAALGVAAFKVAGDFDSAFDKIRTKTGATGATLKGLEGDFKSVFKGVPTDMASASTAIAELNQRLRITGEPLRGLAKDFINLSRITGTDLATNIREGTRLFGDWGVAADAQGLALDKLWRATQVSGIGFETLSAKLVQFGAPLRSMGFSLEESAALLAKWEKEGVNSELVLGSLRIAMGNFARDNVPMREGLDATIKRIQTLGPGAEATSLAMETFGARAGPDMAAAILEGRFAIDDYLAAIENGEDTIGDAAHATEDFGEKFTRMKNTVLVAVQPAVTALMDKLTEFAALLETKVFPKLAEWWATHGPAIEDTFKNKILPAVQEVAGLLRDFFAPAVDTLRDAWANLRPVLEDKVLPILRKIGDFLTEHPILIAVLVGAIATLVSPWLAVVAVIATVLAKWDELASFFTVKLPAAIDSFLARVREIPVLGTIVDYVVEGVVAKFDFLVETFRDVVELVQALIRGDWAMAWEQAKEIVANIVELVVRLFRNEIMRLPKIALEALTTLGTALAEWGPQGYVYAKDLGVSIATGLWDGIKAMTGWLLDQVTDWAQGIFGAVKKGLGKLWPFSPSEAGVDVGRGLGEGIALGIAQSTPLAVGAAQALGAAIMQALKPLPDAQGAFVRASSLAGGLPTQGPGVLGATRTFNSANAFAGQVGGFISNTGSVLDSTYVAVSSAIAGITVFVDQLSEAVSARIAELFGPGVTVRGPIASMAHGGYVPAGQTQLAMLHGPEAVVPMGGMGGGQGEMNVVINIHGTVIQGEQALAEAWRNIARRGGFRGVVNVAGA